MGITTRVREWLTKESAATRAIVYYVASAARNGVWPKRNAKALSTEGYQGNVTAYACISLAMRACAGIPWCLYERPRAKGSRVRKLMTMASAAKAFSSGDGRRRKAAELSEIEDHPLLRLIERPNPLNSGGDLIEAIEASYLIAGNSYVEMIHGGQPVKELWWLRPDRMRVVPHSTKLVSGYIFDESGIPVPYSTDDVFHMKAFHPTDYFYGLSPLEAAARAVDTDNEAQKWNWHLLQNSGTPSGAFVTEQVLADQVFERLKTEIRRNVSGAKNAKRPLVLDGGVGWSQFAHSPAELDWIGGRRLSKQEICSALSVAPELIGDPANKTYANMREARKAFYEDRVLPDMDRLKYQLNNHVAVSYDDRLYLDYDRDQIEALQEEQSALFTRMEGATFLTTNEKRVATGYDEVEHGDEVLVPAGYAPLGQGGDEDPRAPGAADAVDDGGDDTTAIALEQAEKSLARALAAVS